MPSHRLDWLLNETENALARAAAARRRRGLPLIDLTETNPTKVGLVYEEERIRAALAHPEILRHEPHARGLPAAREAVARYLRESRGARVDPSRIVLTASTSEAYALLFKLLCDPGDSVLVPEPSYPLFGYLTALESVEPVPYPLRFDGEWHLDLPALEAALRSSPRARAVLVVNPGNPTGAYLKNDERARLAQLCCQTGCALIGDEVFADQAIAPDPRRVETVAAHDDVLAFALSGLSKVCALPQLKLGWCAISGPPAEADLAAARLELIEDTYLSVNGPVQLAAGELLETRHGMERQLRARLARNRAALLAARPPDATWDVLPAEGGWSAILRVPRSAGEEALALLLLERGVLVHPGYFFDFPAAGAHLVISLLPDERTFAEGAALLASVLRSDPDPC